MNRAIFLDRDGVIIEERSYICHLSQSLVFPFSFEAIALMNRKGFKVIGISNQSSIGRGICTLEQVETIHREIQDVLLKQQAILERFYYCPFHPQAKLKEFRQVHPWRKPQPGMLLQAAKDFNLDLSQSYMIGDSASDIEAGQRAGCKTILVLTGHGDKASLRQKGIVPDLVTENILTAVALIT